MDQDALIDRARRLLDTNGEQWDTLSGRLWSYEDYGLWETARHYFDGKPEVTTTPEGETTESEFRVWCVHEPWRLRLDYLSGRELADEDDGESWPETTVVDGQEWWTLRDGVVERGMMAPEKVFSWPDGRRAAIYRGEIYLDRGGPYVTPGKENLDSLVEPASVASGFAFHGAEMTWVDGRPVIRLDAQPVPGDDFYFRAAGLVLLGVDDYRLSVDVETGIIVEWEALVDGQPARKQVLTIEAANEAIDDGLFVAPTG